MDFRIRPAEPADSPAAVRVVRAVYDEFGFTWDEADYHADLYDLEGHYLQPGHPFLVAELVPSGRPSAPSLSTAEEGKILGTVAVELFDRIPGEWGTVVDFAGKRRAGGADCSMERLYVHPEGRKRGIGRALIEAALAAATENGRTAMELWSDKRFLDAHRLYQAVGAEVIGDRICHDPDQSPEWGLLLRLA